MFFYLPVHNSFHVLAPYLMCATCYECVLNRCNSLSSKARESNFYTTPRRIVVSESFLPLARIACEEMVRGKHWDKATLSPCTGGPATAGDEHLKAFTLAVSFVRGMVVPPVCDGCCSMVNFQAIDHCSDPGDRGHGRQEFFY